MSSGDTARLYHRLTSYEPGREWTTPVEHPRGVWDTSWMRLHTHHRKR